MPVGTQQAVALELFGRCIIGPCQTEAEADAIGFIDPLRYQTDITVNGPDDLVAAVQNASQLWRGRNDAVSGSAGLITRAQADYTRILAALYNQGHYGGAITITIDGREASQLAVGDALDTSTQTPINQVSITVEPGAAYTFGDVSITNSAPQHDQQTPTITAPAAIGFAAGEIAKASVVKQAEQLSLQAWRQQGYALADIADRQVTARHRDDVVDVAIDVSPGPLARYGAVSVNGTQRMDAAFTARQTALVPGEIYNPDDIKRALKRIERLGVFSVTTIDNADELDADGQLPLTLTVEERKLRRIGIGATFSSFDGFGAETYWLHRNLFGRAERLRLDASVGGVGSASALDELTYNLAADFTKPGVFVPDLDFNLLAYARRDTDDGITETLGGTSATLRYFLSDQITLEGGGFVEVSQFKNRISQTDRRFTVLGALGKFSFDSRDNALDPTQGVFVTADARPFYEQQFGNAGIRLEAEGSTYVSLDREDRFILAGRLAIGSVSGPTADETPDNMLFYAGGGGSVRGYGFQSIAITQPDGTKRGGQSKIETSAEIRTKFGGNLGAVAFVDAASISDGALFDDADQWRVGAGVGVRYNTGLGPLRVDVAVPLNRQAGDAAFGVYAGIGQAF